MVVRKGPSGAAAELRTRVGLLRRELRSKLRNLLSKQNLSQITKSVMKKLFPKFKKNYAEAIEEAVRSNPGPFQTAALQILGHMQGSIYKAESYSSDKADFNSRAGKLSQHVAENIKSGNNVRVVVTGNNDIILYVSPISDSFIGLNTRLSPDAAPAEGMPWIGFFIAGSLSAKEPKEKYLWITPSVAAKIGWEFDGALGRFGDGVLAVKTAKLASILLKAGEDPDSMIHPISNASPGDWFSGSQFLGRVNLRKYLVAGEPIKLKFKQDVKELSKRILDRKVKSLMSTYQRRVATLK